MEQRTLLSAGDIDPTFGSGGFSTITAPAGQEASVGGMAVQPDGKVLVGVEFGTYTEDSISPPISCQVRRLLTDGSPDPSFGIAGVVTLPASDYAAQLLLQPNGGILFIGNVVGRLNPDGSLDKTFAAGKGVEALPAPINTGASLQADGGIVIDTMNSSTQIEQIIRFNPNGSRDTTFGKNGIAILPTESPQYPILGIGGITTDSSGRIIVSVSEQEPAASGFETTDYDIIRLLSDGRVDASFGAGGLEIGGSYTENYNSFVTDGGFTMPGPVVVASDGTIYQIGDQDEGTTLSDLFVYTAGVATGQAGPDLYNLPATTSLVVQPDGKLLLAGVGDNTLADDRIESASHPGGIMLDSTFNSDLIDQDPDFIPLLGEEPRFPNRDIVNPFRPDLVLENDGQIIISGGAPTIMRLQGDPTLEASGTIENIPSGSQSSSVGKTSVPGLDVYADLNNNGKLDPGEAETSTGADGTYILEELPAGPIVIREILQPGERQIFPEANRGEHVTISSTPVTAADFAITTKAYIYGTVFNDANSNRKMDSGETGLSKWTVYADLNNDGKFESTEPSTSTDASGGFSFAGLSAGSYIFRVIPGSGWHQTYPSNNFGQHVTLSSGGVLQTVLFGFAQTEVASASISGSVFDDLNDNGRQNSGEIGLAGWTVYLDLSNSGTLTVNDPKTMTEANGDFSFTGLAGGNYIVRVIRPAGWTQTTPSDDFGWHVTVRADSAATGVLFGAHQ